MSKNNAGQDSETRASDGSGSIGTIYDRNTAECWERIYELR
jgi:hypothetical protein